MNIHTDSPLQDALLPVRGRLDSYVYASPGLSKTPDYVLTAIPGPSNSTTVGVPVRLKNSYSYSPVPPTQLPLTYTWTVSVKPVGSTPVVNTTSDLNPLFTADMAGLYILRFLVSDGGQESVALVPIVVT